MADNAPPRDPGSLITQFRTSDHWAVSFARDILWVIAVMAGSVVSLKAVWSFADIANGLMAVPNLISLIALNRVLVSESRYHLWSADTRDI